MQIDDTCVVLISNFLIFCTFRNYTTMPEIVTVVNVLWHNGVHSCSLNIETFNIIRSLSLQL